MVQFSYPAIAVSTTGLATSAKQDTGNTSLASIDNKTPALGQALAAASTPVVLTAAQLTTLTPQTNALTDTQLRATPVPISGTVSTTGLTDTQLRATAVPVSLTSTTITNFPATQAVSAAALPLPTGAATSAKQDTLLTELQLKAKLTDTQPVSLASVPLPTGAATETSLAAASAKLPAALGQNTMANSLTVAIASNQSAIPVTTSVTDVTASGNITTQNLVPAGAATAGSAVASGTLNGAGTAAIQVTGTYTGALSLQYTVDGTNWITVGGTPFLNAATGALSATIASATTGIFQIEANGFPQFRITGLAAMTGTATVTLRTSRSSNIMALDASLPVGTNIIGALVANQSTNVAQINGVAPLMGAGPAGTGSTRISVANAATPTTANVAASATNVTLLASNAARMGATFYNDSASTVYLKFGATASTTSFTVLILANGYYEIPGPHIYSGIVDGIWTTATGAMRVTSW